MKRLAAIAIFAAACATVPDPPPAPMVRDDVGARTEKLQRLDGLFPLFWDEASGRLLMLVARTGEDFIYQVSLPAGVGSNPIGLDRGELGATHLVRFERVGPKGLLVGQNP